MNSYFDPDIGLCDDCGSDEGRRFKRSRIVQMAANEQAQIVVWLCRPCLSVKEGKS